MKTIICVVLVSAAVLSGCATVPLESVKRVPAANVAAFSPTDLKTTVELSKVVIAIERGTEYGQLGMGLICGAGPKLKWEGGTSSQAEGPLIQGARDAFTKAGIRLSGDPSQLFNVGPDSLGELVVAAKIEKIDLKVCGVGTYAGQKGAAHVSVEWQVFSRSAGTVVLTHKNEGFFETTEFKPGGALWIGGAFEEATRHLLNTAVFRDLLTKSPAKGKGAAVSS